MKLDIKELGYDILIVLFKFFSLNDTYKLMLTCKVLSRIKDDIWGILCLSYYPIEFWNKASARPVSVSNPLGSNKLELKRLQIFEKNLGDNWELENYYQLWNFYDNCI